MEGDADQTAGVDEGTSSNRALRFFGQTLAIAAAYFVAGRLALLMAIPPGYATAVWPAAGVALVAVLLVGYRACFGIAIGSFLVNVGTSFDASSALTVMRSLALAASVGAGAALQGASGAFLVRRFVGYPSTLDRPRDIALLLLFGGPASCLLSATWGVTTLLVSGVISAPMYAFSWWTWWVGDAIGVVIFAPLLLSLIGQPREAWRRRRVTVALPLAIGFAVVTAIFVRASTWEQAGHEAAFAHRAEYLVDAIERRISRYVEVVESVAGLFFAERSVRREEFQAFTQGPLARHRGMQALSWNPRVRESARPAYEEAARRDGLPGFELKERDARGALVRAAARDEHVAVFYIEPQSENSPALGFDLASEPRRYEAVDRARDSGAIVATPPIGLVQGREQQPGCLVLVPVYARGRPQATPKQRRESLRGFAVGVLRARDLVEEALGELDREGMLIHIEDASLPGAEGRLYGDEARVKLRTVAEKGWSTSISVAGRTWHITFSPTAAFVASQRSWQAWIVLAGGLFLDGLLGVLLLIVTGRAARLAEAADGLRKSEARTVAVVSSAFDAIVSMDHLGKVVELNPAGEKMFGYRRDDLIGKSMVDFIIPPALREAHRKGLATYLKTGEGPVLGRVVEVSGLRADGSEFPVELAITRVKGQEPALFTGFIRDMTERKAQALRARRLQELTVALSQAAGPQQVVDAVLREGLAALEAASGAVLFLSEDASHLAMARAVGYPAHVAEGLAKVPLDAPLSPCDAVRTRRAVVLGSMAERREKYPGAPFELDDGAVVALPLLVEGRAIGAIRFHYAQERRFSEDDQRFMDVLASYCAQALDRARLLEAEQRARAATARHARRVEVLAEASKAFSQVALDLEAALRTSARLIAESVGDGCAIFLLSADSRELTTPALHHADPAAEEALRHLLGQPVRAEDSSGGQVALSGKPLLIPKVDLQSFRGSVAPQHWPLIERAPLQSLLIVPLRVRQKTLGSLAVARYQPDHPYTEEDQGFVQELGDRAAVAIEDARLFHETREAIALRDNFISIASHELRTPLTALQLQIESLHALILSGQVTGEQAGRKASLAKRQTERIGRLIDGLLDVSRLTSGQFVLNLEEVDLFLLARETAERFDVEARRAGCSLKVSGVGVRGQWDRMRLEQVLSNLLSNAIKYATGAPIDVTVEDTGDGRGRLVVRDGGAGIAAEDADRIFGRFERAVSPGHYGGLGLGLFVSRQIVEAHGGSITVQSEPGKGSSFVVTLSQAVLRSKRGDSVRP